METTLFKHLLMQGRTTTGQVKELAQMFAVSPWSSHHVPSPPLPQTASFKDTSINGMVWNHVKQGQ